MKWKVMEQKAKSMTEMLVECFGDEDKKYFVEHKKELLPFRCSPIPANLVSLSIMPGGDVTIVEAPMTTTHKTKITDEVYGKGMEMMRELRGTEINLILTSSSLSLLSLYYRQPEKKYLTYAGEDVVERFRTRYSMEAGRQYTDKNWGAFWGTWNLSSTSAVLIMKKLESGAYHPRWVGMKSLAEFAVDNGITETLAAEAVSLGDHVVWYWAFVCVGGLPEIPRLNNNIVSLLEYSVLKSIKTLGDRKESGTHVIS